MSKFCGKCGTSVPDNVAFCPNCGSQMGASSQQQVVPGASSSSSNPLKAVMEKLNGKNKNILIIAAAGVGGVILLIIAIAVLSSLFSGGYKGVAKDYFSAIENYDAEKLADVYPEFYKRYMYEVNDYTEEELIEYMDETIDEIYYDLDCGREIDISYEIKSTYEPTDFELSELEDDLYERYADDIMSRNDFEIDDAVLMYVRVDFEGTRDSYSESIKMLAVKEDGDWKLYLGYTSADWAD